MGEVWDGWINGGDLFCGELVTSLILLDNTGDGLAWNRWIET
jgi:hypothetical protein